MKKISKRLLLGIFAFMCLTYSAGCALKQMGASGNLNKIETIDVDESKVMTSIVIGSEAPAIYTAFKLANPLRIVLDINDSDVSAIKTPISVNNKIVEEIRTTQFDEEGANIGRIEIFLKQISGYKIDKDGNKLSVSIENYADANDSIGEDLNAGALEAIDVVSTEDVDEAVDEPITDEGIEVGGGEVMPEKATPEIKYPPAKVLNDFSVVKDNGTVAVVITGDGSIGSYNAFRLGKPARVVVDIFDVKNQFKRDKIKVNENILKTIRIGQHKKKVRIVLDSLKGKPADYFIEKHGKSLIISLGQKGLLKKMSPPTSVAAVAPAYSESVVVSASSDTGDVKITDLKFTQLPNASRIIVSASRNISYEISKDSPELLVLDFPDTTIPKSLQRSLDTSEFNSPISLVSSYQTTIGGKKTTKIAIKLKKKAKYVAEHDKGMLFIDFERDSSGDRKEIQTASPVVIETPGAQIEDSTLVVTSSEEKDIGDSVMTADMDPADKVESLTASEPDLGLAAKSLKVKKLDRIYSGQRVSLDYKDADIGNVLRLFAEISGFNVIAADDVKGTVTIKLSDVPWDQAFDIILNSKQLGMVQIGNVIRVAPAEKLKKEEAETLTSKKDKEMLVELDSEIVPVSHAPVSEMASKVKELLTDRGSVTVDERSSLLIIRDIERTIEEAKLLIKELDKPTPQVLIEARIVEVDTNYKKDLGVQWGSQYAVDAAHGNALDYRFPNSVGVGLGAGGGSVLNAPGGSGVTGTGLSGGSAGGAIGISFGSIDNTISLDLKLSALESKGVSKIISRPRIVTINKKKASIQQGLSIPFETTSAEGTQTQFVDASLQLTVTPEVKQDKSIILTIEVTKNEPDFARAGSGGAPSIAKKEAKTEVLIKGGDTTVIGGIFTQKKGQSEAGVPFLSKLPLIGWLFKTTNKTDDKAELLIFVTPRIIEKAI